MFIMSINVITSGVPQGGHLSPVLFSLYVNNVKSVIKHCQLLLFVSEIKLFHRISTPQDCIPLQDDLNSLVSWAVTYGLDLCIPKCNFMYFYCSPSCPFNSIYSVSGVLLEPAGASVNDLGKYNICLKGP